MIGVNVQYSTMAITFHATEWDGMCQNCRSADKFCILIITNP